MTERDAFIGLNLLPLSPAELRRLLDMCASAVSALDAIGTGAVRTEDLWVQRPGTTCTDEGDADPEGSQRRAASRRSRFGPRRIEGRPCNEVPLDAGAALRLGVAGLARLARLEIERVLGKGMRIETLADAAYPALLREIADPPPVLYIWGALEPDDEVRMGIVGSRRATGYGLEAAGLLARDLTRRGLCIVSGLARGIDASAHKAALEAGGRTIAVLGSGLGRMYPREHANLAKEIARSGGAVVSEYPFQMPPLSLCFPRRNRVISGLSAGVVVVEAARASGALGTARLALEQGREVFAVPGPATHATSIGTNGLLRAGAAHLACVAQDVLDELPPPIRVQLGLPADVADEPVEARRIALDYPLGAPEHELARPSGGSAGPDSLLDPETASVLRHLSDGNTLSIDELVTRSGLPVSRALAALSILEMRGLTEALPGDRVTKTKGRLV